MENKLINTYHDQLMQYVFQLQTRVLLDFREELPKVERLYYSLMNIIYLSHPF